MEDKCLLEACNHQRENGDVQSERKCHPNALRDVKRKLTFVNKKIGDLQHQRKFAYKNSAKVKKMVHNQVNQIVKCLRARERNLWADVDESYLSQDASISDELSRLQSVHAHCQALLNYSDDIGGNTDILCKIYSILSEVNFGGKSDVKPLQFISDLEAMKTRANYFGRLDVSFIKKDDFILMDKNDSGALDLVSKEFHGKEECLEKTMPIANIEFEASQNCIDEFLCKRTESEDSFEIVDLLDNMCCEDFDKDSIMDEQNSVDCTQQTEGKEFTMNYSSGNESKLVKVCNSLENSREALKREDFNPEEEWKQIFEMRNKLANFCGIASKLSDEKKIQCGIKKTADNCTNTDKFYDKNCKQNKFLSLKGADKWLHNRSSEKDTLKKERNCASPAELIRKAFTPYLSKDSIENWLLSN